MPKLILFNKPFQVVSQFTDGGAHTTLAAYIPVKNVYVAGRLDYDSEGLLLLTDDGRLQHKITHPTQKMWKSYWAQVEGEPDDNALAQLAKGVMLNDGVTKPAKAACIPPPDSLWERDPPIRVRKAIPTAWISLSIREGRNRQVRRMTAAVGFPTLRLIRYAIGPWTLEGLAPGEWRQLDMP